jgi:hypothetical protein
MDRFCVFAYDWQFHKVQSVLKRIHSLWQDVFVVEPTLKVLHISFGVPSTQKAVNRRNTNAAVTGIRYSTRQKAGF